MTVQRARQSLYRTLLSIGICGYEVAAGLTSLVDALSTPASVAVRLFVVCCALATVLLDFGKAFGGSRRLILGFCLFWSLYLLRIAHATILSTEPLAFPAWYYYAWSIGACALPMFGLSLWSPRYEDADRNFMVLFAALALAGLLASFGASSIELKENNELVDTGRLQLAALNPILLGQLGTTLVVMAAWVLANRHHRFGMTAILLFLAAAVVGSVLLIGANSRGPLVSAAACLLFITMASSKRSRLYAIMLLIVAAIAFVPATQYLESEYGFTTYTRLFEQSQLTEVNTLDRLSRFDGAIDAFMANPLFGASLEEPRHGGYPHNLFIEAMMTTGIFGVVLLVVLMATTFAFSIRLYVSIQGYGWASVLFVQYLVAAQFSGSIYTVNYLWITVGLVIAIYASLVHRTRTRSPRLSSGRQVESSNLTRVARAARKNGAFYVGERC